MNYKILGAGPAGLCSAITLSKKGLNTTIYEKNGFIGANHNLNIQVMRNYGSDKNIVEKIEKHGIKMPKLNPIKKIIKYSPSYRCDEIYSEKEPLFYSFKRGSENDSIESSLANQAQDIGTNIEFNTTKKIADCHIIASGPRFAPEGIGYGATFEGSVDKDTIQFFYGSNLIENGYGYIAPYGKNLFSVSITSFSKSNFGLIKKRFEKFLKTDKITKELIDGKKKLNEFSGSGFFNIPKTAVHNYKYFVGGTAGFVDPARGFGVKYAILSGIFAAKSILDKKLDYDKLWQDEFKEELLDGFNRRVLLDKLKTSDYEKFVEGKKVNIKDYKKVPNAIKEIFLKINGQAQLNKWQKKFELSELLEL